MLTIRKKSVYKHKLKKAITNECGVCLKYHKPNNIVVNDHRITICKECINNNVCVSCKDSIDTTIKRSHIGPQGYIWCHECLMS